jgi:RNase P subunit RPR2
MMIKEILVQCEKCNWINRVPDSDKEFNEMVELDICPKCNN